MECIQLKEGISVQPEAAREKVFEALYKKAFPGVARFVSKMNGTLEDSSDIFQDALVIYYEKSQDESFVLQTSTEAYILGIAKHLWIRKFTRDRMRISLDSTEINITLPNDYVPTINTNQLLKFIEQSGRKCMELLHTFYYEKVSMKEIAGRFGFITERSATVQKFKCLEKVRDKIKEKSIAYEDFIE
ncbi:RNA polymerase sigma factor [Ohtaekwangia koreensis]|uniref:RNA polymerase sigma factor, sigma-70 family n=1 Tax=Ohtaekwangia koreensis TaxID=688867 RepID=A0A1T5KCV9_9BACT|nr:sigma-70 family RNA polymerase sigma factor [Ohtaekwangia koreensis]SKC61517.1 RNA polymerase sigma factor, sigma-70 family [Ohtaekwangia koreensis]